jgi:hypothetical protein
MAGPDVGFASAAAAAAAVAAAAGSDGQNPSSSSSSQNPSSSSSSSSTEPSPLTLQAHAILHCIADLHRLTIRREWTPKGGTAWRQQLHTKSSSPFAPGTSPYVPRQQQLQQQGLGLGLGGSSPNPSSSSGSPSSSGSSSSSSAPPVQAGCPVTPPVAAANSSSSSSSSSISSSTAGSSSSSTGSSSSSSSSSSLGFRQPSSQLLLSCDEGAWGVVGLMLVAWLHWHCGVSQATAVESVSQALGVNLNEVG